MIKKSEDYFVIFTHVFFLQITSKTPRPVRGPEVLGEERMDRYLDGWSSGENINCSKFDCSKPVF